MEGMQKRERVEESRALAVAWAGDTVTATLALLTPAFPVETKRPKRVSGRALGSHPGNPRSQWVLGPSASAIIDDF